MNKFKQHDLTADIVKTNNPRIGLIALSTDPFYSMSRPFEPFKSDLKCLRYL